MGILTIIITIYCSIGEIRLVAINQVAVTGFLGFPALLARVILAPFHHDFVGDLNIMAMLCGVYVDGDQ